MTSVHSLQVLLGRSYLGGCSPCPVSANARAASCSISYKSCSVSWSDVCHVSSSPWPLRLSVEALKSHSRLLGVEQADRGTQLLDSAVWDASSSPVPSDSLLTRPRPVNGAQLKLMSLFVNCSAPFVTIFYWVLRVFQLIIQQEFCIISGKTNHYLCDIWKWF